MPELPEVETVRRGLENHLTGRLIERVELRRLDLRFPFPEGFAALLRGRLVESVERRAKYLLIRLEGKVTWMCHLGMTGRWTLLGANSSEADDGSHDWVVVHPVSYTHLRAHETRSNLVCRLLLEKKKTWKS